MALVVVASLVLFGCRDRGDWVGEWKGLRTIPANSGVDPLIATSLANVTLVIKTDGRFELTEETFGKAGSASLGADSGTLYIDSVLDRRPPTLGANGERWGGERKLKLQKDGTILFERPDSEPMILKRTSQNPQSGQSEAQ